MRCALLVFALVALAGMDSAQVVTGVGNLVRTVADLDKAVALYRDGLGLEVVTQPGPFLADDAMMRLGNTAGAQVRTAELRVPGSRIGVELIEYRGIDRQPAPMRMQDPGAGVLRMGEQDRVGASRKARSAGWRPVTGTVIGQSVAEILQDGDGFAVELIQGHSESSRLVYPTAPPRPAPWLQEDEPDGFEFAVADLDKTMNAYRAGTGLPMAGLPATGNRQGQFRMGTATITFVEFKTADRKPLHTRVQDPGTSTLQLYVHGLDAMLARMKAAGFTVASSGGVPANVGSERMALVRDLNDLYLELIERDVI